MSEAPPRVLPRCFSLSILAVLCLIWGSTWLVLKHNVVSVPPWTAAATRMGLASAVMLLVAPLLHRFEGGRQPPWWLWVPFGLSQFSLSFVVIYHVAQLLPSGLNAVLWAIYPLLMALGSHLFLVAERLRLSQVLGFLCGFTGIVALFVTDLTQFGPEAVPNALLLLTSPLMVAVVTLWIKHHGAGVSSMLLNRNAMVLGAVLLGAGAFLFERHEKKNFDREAVFCITYLALVGTVMTFGLYFWLMRHIEAYRLSLIAYITPAIALLLGALVDGEPVYWHTILGFVLILFGVALASGALARLLRHR